jgi:tripartite-type tricarboxylate transporter receptor subunit TctC
MKIARSFRTLLASLLVALSASASQAAWPERPLRIIVPAAAGGSPDIVCRIVGEELARRLGQPVIVENRPGAAGNIGLQALQTAAPDGYTIGYGNNATLATNQFLFSRLPYDPDRLLPIVALVSTSSLLVVNKDLPVRNVRELIAFGKRTGPGLSFGSAGTGTASHLGAELLKTLTGMSGQHVPYKGGPQAITDLMGGNVQFIFDNIASVGPSVAAGKVRAIAVTAKKRSPLFPDVPTLDEAGVPGFEMTAWGGLVAPPGTPQEVVSRINKEVNAMFKDEKVRAQLERQAFSPIGGTPQRFSELMASERSKWGDVVRKSGAKVD